MVAAAVAVVVIPLIMTWRRDLIIFESNTAANSFRATRETVRATGPRHGTRTDDFILELFYLPAQSFGKPIITYNSFTGMLGQTMLKLTGKTDAAV